MAQRYESATTSGCHQGHIWVAPRSHVGASGDMRVPPCLGATKVILGGTKVICGCHQVWVPPRSHVGVSGVMWVPQCLCASKVTLGATKVTCG